MKRNGLMTMYAEGKCCLFPASLGLESMCQSWWVLEGIFWSRISTKWQHRPWKFYKKIGYYASTNSICTKYQFKHNFVTFINDHTIYMWFFCKNAWTWMSLICLQKHCDVQSFQNDNWSHYNMEHKRYLVLRWVSFQNGSDMSTARDLLNDMYCVPLRCGSFQNESGMFTKLTREVDHSEPWYAAWRHTVSM